MKIKIALHLLIVFIFFSLSINPAIGAPENRDPNKEIEELEKKILEFGREFEKKLLETIQQMLDDQIQKMEKNKQKTDRENKALIEKFNQDLKQNPDNAQTYFSLGEAYDSIGDGANAIINTLKAEEIFLQQKDRSGVAKCRRALRNYYAKYDFKPEDFKISQLISGSRK